MYRILVTRQSRYPADTKRLKEAVKAVLQEHNVKEAEVSIALVGVRKIRELSRKHLGEDERHPLHEVLSFPSSPNGGPLGTSPSGAGQDEFVQGGGLLQLGDIVVCYPEARRMAMKRNRFVDDILQELVEHSTLHLLGIHHS